MENCAYLQKNPGYAPGESGLLKLKEMKPYIIMFISDLNGHI